MAISVPRRLFTVDEYYEMARVGILKPDERVELLDVRSLRCESEGGRSRPHCDHAGLVVAAERLRRDVAHPSVTGGHDRSPASVRESRERRVARRVAGRSRPPLHDRRDELDDGGAVATDAERRVK